nr:hypothetical protein [Bacteroidota bacterium]
MKPNQRLANWLATKNKDYKQGVDILIDLEIDSDKNQFFLKGPGDKLHMGMLFRQ